MQGLCKRLSKIRLGLNISNLIRISLHNGKGGKHWEDLVGYTLIQLKRHLENQFIEGMSWEKYLSGKIHIDHIIPISVFNFTKPEHIGFKKAWSLENLQPLWAKDNLSKHNRLDYDFQGHLAL